MPKYDSPALRAAFAAWGRQKGIRPASTEAGLRVQLAQFIADTRARVDNIGAAGDNVYAGDPLQVAEQKITMLRNSGGLVDITEPETEDSDFGDLIRQRVSAMDEAGGDDLAAAAIIKGQNKAAAQAASPSANTNPVSATDSIMGGQATVSPGCMPIEVARWNGNNNESTNVTVTAGSVQFGPVAFPTNQRGQNNPYLIVQWGTQGYALQAQVDIVNGTQFTIGGSFVSLSVTSDPFQTLSNGSASAPISAIVTAMLSFKQVTGSSPTRTVNDFSFDSNNLQTYMVPPFAKNLTVWAPVFSFNTLVYVISFFDGGGYDIGGSAVTLTNSTANSMSQTIRVPPNAVTFAMNFQAPPAQQVKNPITFVFDLSF